MICVYTWFTPLSLLQRRPARALTFPIRAHPEGDPLQRIYDSCYSCGDSATRLSEVPWVAP
jgi:hypothetical protein